MVRFFKLQLLSVKRWTGLERTTERAGAVLTRKSRSSVSAEVPRQKRSADPDGGPTIRRACRQSQPAPHLIIHAIGVFGYRKPAVISINFPNDEPGSETF